MKPKLNIQGNVQKLNKTTKNENRFIKSNLIENIELGTRSKTHKK